MKEKDLENIFKDAFQNYEAKVDPSVWSSLENSLDTTASGSGNTPGASDGGSFLGSLGSSSGLGLAAAGVAVISIALVSYLILSQPSDIEESPAVVENTISGQSNETTLAPVATDEDLPSQKQDKEILPSSKEKGVESSEENRGSDSEQVLESSKLNSDNSASASESKRATQNKNIVNAGETVSSTQEENSRTIREESAVHEKKKAMTEDEQIREVIEIHKKEPIAFINANPVSGTAPLLVNFENMGYAVKQNWDFGDGEPGASGNSIVHQFERPGKYKVILTALDAEGHEQRNSIFIEVKAAPSYAIEKSQLGVIPNVFTPNGDGKNDQFKLETENLEKLDFRIFDQNGQLVYKWKHIDDEWDGRLSTGAEAPSGTYFYLLKARGKDQKGYEHKGSVTLFR